MLALVYLGLAIVLGDLICRRFYRFVSVPHRWAAAILVGILASTWFTYLAGLALAHTAEPLLAADVLFFAVAPGAIFWLSRKAPQVSRIPVRAIGSSRLDWITLAALCAAACVLLIGTLYVNKRGQLSLSGTGTTDFAAQLTFAQNVGVVHDFPIAFAGYGVQGIQQFLFYFQAGNLDFLGLNLAWSVDVLSVLSLASMLALVMALGELVFHSRVVGRLGAVFVLFHGFLERLTNLAAGHSHREQSWQFWKQIAFVTERHVPFAVGIFLLVLIFLIDQYRGNFSATGASSGINIGPGEPKQGTSENRLKTAFPYTIIRNSRAELMSAKGLVFSGLLVAALLPWNTPIVITTAVVLCCLFVAYCCWRLSTLKTAVVLGKVLVATVAACILAAGVSDLLAVYSSSRLEVKPDTEPLVKGLAFRNSMIYNIPGAPITAFEGGHGNGKGQFKNPHGLAVDAAGNIFVADTDNGRIEKFSPNGTFVMSIHPLDAPNGIAVDRAGNIYVAEIGSKHRVQKLRTDGTFIAEWAPGLYGPRKIAIGPDDSIYVVDSGRNRIVKFSADGQVPVSWGSEGTGDGQFKGLSSVAADLINDKVYVADPMNNRIQVFDSNGKFLTKWLVPEWGQPLGFEDLVIDSQKGRLYASSGHMNSILAFDLQGNKTGTLTPTPPDKLDEPSAIVLAKDKLLILNAGSARVSIIPLLNR